MVVDNEEQNAKFAAVVTPHLGDAYTLARWLTRSRADADDVLQEACIRALKALRTAFWNEFASVGTGDRPQHRLYLVEWQTRLPAGRHRRPH